MDLTEEQKAFLAAEGCIVLCAVPGSGKTYIVAQKLLNYLKRWKYLHRGVAALSFTNVASDEIRRQLQELENKKTAEIRYPHFVGTLDSFINNYILLRFGYLMQKENRRRPIIIHENYGELNFHPRHEICYKKGCAQHPEWFCWSSQGLLKDGAPYECEISQKPCLSFKKALIKKGVVTQREVSALSLMLLKKYPQIAVELAYRFPVILVDEAQDTSREQMEILECLAASGAQTVILVGDPDQALYEWRDATPDSFINKMHDEHWMTMRLSSNFRSSQLICNAVKPFSKMLETEDPASAHGEYADFPIKPVLFRVSAGKTREDIVAAFLHLCEENSIRISSENIAVLTRGKVHSNLVPDIWKTPETASLAAATYHWHHANRSEAFRLCEKALYSIMIGCVEGLTQNEIHQKADSYLTSKVWKSTVIELLKILPSPTLSLRDWNGHIVKELETLEASGRISSYDGRTVSEIIKIKTRDKKIPDFKDRTVSEYFEKRVRQNVTISSVHGVKGETFDATLLIVDSTKGANALTPAILNAGELGSELIRIAYVAMTRPRKILAVSLPQSFKELQRFPEDMWDYQAI